MFFINRYILLFIFNKLVEFHNKLQAQDEEIISLLEANLRKIDDNLELHIISVLENVELIIMDLLTEILQSHYDSRWIVSNTNIDNDPRAAYFRQMENGMYVRMALMLALI